MFMLRQHSTMDSQTGVFDMGRFETVMTDARIDACVKQLNWLMGPHESGFVSRGDNRVTRGIIGHLTDVKIDDSGLVLIVVDCENHQRTVVWNMPEHARDQVMQRFNA